VARIRADNLDQAWAHFYGFVQLEAEVFGEHFFFAGIMESSVLSRAAKGTLEREGMGSFSCRPILLPGGKLDGLPH